MAVCEKFYTWGLRRQMLATLTASSMMIVAIFIIITRLQLDWLKDDIMTRTEQLLKDYTNRSIYMNAK